MASEKEGGEGGAGIDELISEKEKKKKVRSAAAGGRTLRTPLVRPTGGYVPTAISASAVTRFPFLP